MSQVLVVVIRLGIRSEGISYPQRSRPVLADVGTNTQVSKIGQVACVCPLLLHNANTVNS